MRWRPSPEAGGEATGREEGMVSGAWRLSRGRAVVLDRPRIVGILNVTPDSFSDGGRYPTVRDAADAAERMVRDGADVIDTGGESTRPGAAGVAPEEQVRRVVPVIAEIRRRGIDAGITVDTTHAGVAAAALDAGADGVNDVSAGLGDPAMLALCAERRCGVVLMHRLAEPAADSYSDRYATPPRYRDVCAEVAGFLSERAGRAERAGVPRDAIVVDPGLGFGKSVEQNIALILGTGRIAALGYPVMSGVSRKSFAGRVMLGRDSTPAERLEPTLTLSAMHLAAGAMLFRVHDVAAHARVLAEAWAGRGSWGSDGRGSYDRA